MYCRTTRRSGGAAMRTFTLDSDDNIKAVGSVEEADVQPGVERFHSAEQLSALAKGWPGGRLVKIWNKLAGVHPVKKFTDRQTGASLAAARPNGDKRAA